MQGLYASAQHDCLSSGYIPVTYFLFLYVVWLHTGFIAVTYPVTYPNHILLEILPIETVTYMVACPVSHVVSYAVSYPVTYQLLLKLFFKTGNIRGYIRGYIPLQPMSSYIPVTVHTGFMPGYISMKPTPRFHTSKKNCTTCSKKL